MRDSDQRQQQRVRESYDDNIIKMSSCPCYRRRRRRPQARSHHHHHHSSTFVGSVVTSFSSLSLLLLSLLSPVAVTTTHISQQEACLRAIKNSDYERDDSLTQSEFTLAITELSKGRINAPDFRRLPSNLQETFQDLSHQRHPPLVTQDSNTRYGRTTAYISLLNEQSRGDSSHLHSMCEDIQHAVDQAVLLQTRQQTQADSNDMPQPSINLNPPTCSPDLSPSLALHTGLPEPTPIVTDSSTTTTTTTTSRRRLQTLQQCKIAMSIGDSNRNNLLSKDPEYVRFVNQLSSQRFGSIPYEDLPGVLQQNYDKFAQVDGQISVAGSKPGQSASAEQEAFLISICDDTIEILSNPIAPSPPTGPAPTGGGTTPTGSPPPPADIDCSGTIPQNQCNTAIAIADLGRDNLLSQSEFVRFVNRLSSNAYLNVVFTQLPPSLIAVYNKFATTGGQVGVDGSKPGQTPTAQQLTFLAALCCETDYYVQNPEAPTTPGTPTGPEPTPTAPVGPPAPTYDSTVCRTAMASSDFNRDDSLNQAEYVRFLNRLTQNEFLGLNFDDLDTVLQDNFNNLVASTGQISIFGTKPGQSTNAPQEANLNEICAATSQALNPVLPSEPTGPTTPAPAPSGGGMPTPTEGSPPPTFLPSTCRTAMASSDFNRDDALNEAEYVRLLNRLTRNEFLGQSFEELDSLLQESFRALVGIDGLIDIFGSKPGQSASVEQEEYLSRVCLETAIALLGEQTPAPVGGDTPAPGGGATDPPAPAPSLAPGLAEVFNSFIISNTRDNSAADLANGINREGLNNAYGSFAERAVGLIECAAVTSRLRGRKLAVSFVPGSDEIYLLLDSECPESVEEEDAVCQIAFAKFRVQLGPEDQTLTSDCYTQETQGLIGVGALQAALTEEDERNILTIIMESYPVSSTFPPTTAPLDEAPTAAPEQLGGGEGGIGIGVIAGAAGGGVVLLAALGYAYIKGLFPSFGGGAGMKKAKDDDDDDDDDDDGSAGSGGRKAKKKDDDDDDGSDNSDDKSAFGDKPKDDNAFGKDIDPFDKQEQNPGEDKNTFGFGRKNKKDKESKSEDNAFGDDLPPPAASFGDDDKSNDFADYAFDEPSVGRDGGEAQETGSVGGAAENLFDAPASPAWPSSGDGGGNFFGTNSPGGGWGAGGGGGGGGVDNFFAPAAFGEEKPQSEGGSGSESGSGSGSESDSYTSSGDSTYESDGEEDDEGSGSFDGDGSRPESAMDGSSGKFDSESSPGSLPSQLRQKSEDMDAMIASGDWEGVAASATSFKTGDDSLEHSYASQSKASQRSGVSGSGSSRSGTGSEYSGSDGETTETSLRTEDREKRAEYRTQVEALVQMVVPDEIGKVDAMMEQFKGREAELVSTLQTMQERSATQRARAAVHKSKTRPSRGDGPYRPDGAFSMQTSATGGTEGSAAGTAAIAAASLPIPAESLFDDGDDYPDDLPPEDMGFGGDAFEDDMVDDGEGSYYSGDSRSHSGSGSRSRSHSGSHSGSGSRSRSHSGSHSGSGSRSRSHSGSGSRSRSHSGSGSRSRSRSGSEGSRSGPYSDEGSGPYSDEGSGPYSDEGSGPYSDEGSRSRSGSGGSRSGGSRSGPYSDEGSGPYSDEGSRSRSGSGGSRSGPYSDEGSGPYSDEEGSGPYSDEGSQSQGDDGGWD